MKGFINTPDGLRLRQSYPSGEIILTMPYKTVVNVLKIENGWANISLEDYNEISFSQTFWASMQYITSLVNTYSLGVHFINNHQEARKALERGLKAALVMNGKTSAAQLAKDFPNSVIVYRRDYEGQTAQQFFNALEVAVDDPPNLYYVGMNEGATNSDKTIRDRFGFDLILARLINDRRKTATPSYLAFSGGHGNPAWIEQKWMQDLMRNTYAKAYNDGVFAFDCHNYTCGTYPRLGTFVDPSWYEIRSNRLFYDCGFNPIIKNVWHTESGIEGGCGDGKTKPGIPGGFRVNNYTVEEFRAWVRREKQIQSNKVVVNSVSFDSPNRVGFVFQRGDPGMWGGYNLTDDQLNVMLEEQ